MKYKKVDSVVLPEIGIGTWSGLWGSSDRPTKDTVIEDQCKNALRHSISLGATHIDTAEVYGAGHAEELVGKVISDYDRSSLFITSKVAGSNLGYGQVLESCQQSLDRLSTDYIDLYLIHWPSNSDVPIAETMRAMDDLVDQGKIRHIGVSNFSLEQLIEAKKATRHGVVAIQVEYNLLRRDNGRHSGGAESEVLPYCQEEGIFLIAYCPLAKGELSGTEKHPIIDQLAKKYSVTNSQVALAWLLSKDNVVVIPQSTNVEHITQNVQASGLEISDEDLLLLDELGK